MRKLSLALALFLSLAVLGRAQTQADSMKFRGSFYNSQTIVISGATPSVVGGNVFVTNNGSSTTVTNLLGGSDSQPVTIFCGDTNTTFQNNSNLVLASGGNYTCTLLASIEFVFYAAQGKWIQTPSVGAAASLATPVINPNPLAFDTDLHFKGPDPWNDATRYGARSMNPNVTPASVGLTANCTMGLPTVTISSASTFQTGDGVTLYGCGASQSMSTPGAPTVTPSLPTSAGAVGGLGYTVAGPSGSTTYNYQIIARDKNGGLTAASTVGTTAAGASSLGLQGVSITSLSRASSGVVTVVTSSAHGLVTGSMVKISGTTNEGDFGGWFVVSGSADNTHFTFSNGMTTVETATGGTANWWNCNHLSWSPVTGAWEYYIYGRTGGSLTRLGVSKPSAGGLTDTTWDDYGSPMMDGIALPPYVPNTPPGSATNDNLTTTIVSGAGTTSLTLATNAGATVSGVTIRYDACPNIVTAAANSNFSAPLHFPTGTFVVNSYCDVSANSGLTISQVGTLVLDETLVLPASVKWYGDRIPPGNNGPSFGFQGGTPVSVVTGNPGVYVPNGNSTLFQGLQFSGSANAAQMMVMDGVSNQVTLNDVTFSAVPGGSDWTTIGINFRSNGIGNNIFELYLNRILLLGGSQANLSPAPMLICDRCGATQIYSLQANGRSMFFTVQETGGQLFNLDFGYIQGGVQPFLMSANRGTLSGYYVMKHIVIDTDGNAIFAWTGPGSATPPSLVLTQFIPPSLGVGTVSGIGPLASIVTDSGTSGQNTNVTSISGASVAAASSGTGASMKPGIQVSGALGMGYGLPRPAAPTVVVGAHSSCSSNCVAANTYFYFVSANDANGGFSASSVASTAATTDGTQTITVSWAPLNGQVSMNVGRALSAPSGTFLFQPGGGVGGTSFVDSSLNFYTASPPTTATGFSEGISSSGFAGHQALLVDPNSAFRVTAAPATLTANRTATFPDGNSVAPIFQDCGTTSTCANTVQAKLIVAKGGPISLSGGTITITSLPFSSSTSYVCLVDDSTAIAALQVVYNSGSSVTFNGTTTDAVRYVCTGN